MGDNSKSHPGIGHTQEDIISEMYNERTSLLHDSSLECPTRTHSVLSGIQGAILEPQDVYKSRWRSIRVMYLTMFLSSVSFSICMSSLYPYLKILDTTANTDYLGWVVAAYSVGQLAASPLFGFWSSFRAKTREPIIASLVISIVANMLYMYLETITTNPKVFLIVSRVLVGFGAGSVAVARSYVSGTTTITERTSAMANMSTYQAVGFIIGPLLQTAMVPIGYPGPIHMAGFHFDMYTATGLFSVVACVANIILLIAQYHRQVIFTIGCTIKQTEVKHADYIAVGLTVLLFVSALFTFAVFETIITPLSMHMFAWKNGEATMYVGIILGCAAIVSVSVFAAIKVLSRRMDERYLLLGGFTICLLAFVVYLPWGSHYPDIQIADIERTAQVSLIPKNTLNDNITGIVSGCPYIYKWCIYTPKLYLWQFLLGTFLIAVGYPTCNLMSYTIYSKILGPIPQGLWMGLLTASGSFARILGPVFVSQVYDAYGPRVSFVTMIITIAITLVGLITVFKKLVPFKVEHYIERQTT